MKLHTYPLGPNPRRVHVYLAEKGIEVPIQIVDLMKRENRTPEFMAQRNVMGGLPVLELDDGTHIAESVAICRYFEALHPEPSLFGSTPADQGRIEMWNRRIELNFMMPVGQVWIHDTPATRGVIQHPIKEMADQSRKLVSRYYRFLDEQLASRPFIAGDAFSMADILALTTADFATGLVQLPIDTVCSNLLDWHARVSARPAVQAAAAAARRRT